MKSIPIEQMSDDELVDRFKNIALQQDRALLWSEIATFNKLFDQMKAVREELRIRPGDRRRLLTRLYNHENAQVRLKAAVNSLAVEPDVARRVLESLASSRKYPQAGDAGMVLEGLDSGQFNPV